VVDQDLILLLQVVQAQLVKQQADKMEQSIVEVVVEVERKVVQE
jgi:hypothetical protein